MNRKIGLIASGVVSISVALFAVFMLLGISSAAYTVCIFLACSYLAMACAYSSYAAKETQSAKYIGMGFAILYAVFVILVYYAQVTTVRQYPLSEQAQYLLDYEKFGLYFGYDLFGYGMLAISTFFIGLTITPKKRETKILKTMLLIHGVFCVVCFIPALGIFSPDMAGGEIIGIAVLEVWCIYFLPVSILSFRHFKNI
ncbi:hypothetical protein LJC74_04400 [Eubacteriales bacterium OttesenSCG-928-A19]|nr:hypothetical protein [Eubacteriales bacterium OttesenSCG-928-A19]